MNIYCKAPFTSLTIREDGIVRTCCPGKTDLGNLNVQSISAIIADQYLTQIRADILNGLIPDNCNYCKKIESQGLNSMRKFYNDNDYDLDSLRFLDLRWNTVCNLTCIYCDELWSSSWAKKKNYDVSIKKNYDNDLLDWILNHSKDLSTLMLVGGEPLLMKQNIKLLSEIENTDLEIRIITNLSSNIEKNPVSKVLIERFKNVDWTISVENIRDKYEYVRHGANWTQLEQNLTYLNANHAKISLLMVYGLFSAFNLFETVTYFYYTHNIKAFGLQIVGKHDILDVLKYNVQVIERSYQELIKIKEWITTSPDNNLVIDNLDLFIDTIKQNVLHTRPSTINKSKFLEEISKYDNETKFSDVWNEEFLFIMESLK